MLKVDRAAKTFSRLPNKTLSDTGILERSDLQAMIAASPTEFFAELGERVLLLAQELRPDDVVEDRIDLLAVDEDGASVIIELKRGNHRMHLLQAISYAGMLAKIDKGAFVERIAQFSAKAASQIEEELEDFVEGGATSSNQSQRIVLIAEEFDYSVLISAEWLSEHYGVDVRCYRLKLAGDNSVEFLSCERVYPPAELTEQATRVRTGFTRKKPHFKNWTEALAGIENKDIVEFFKQEIANGRTGYPERRILNWKENGHRRFWMAARKNYSYGWQMGRFEGDVAFWRSMLECDDAEIAVVGKNDNRVRFRLRTAAQVKAFRGAVTGQLAAQPFVNASVDYDVDEDSEEDSHS